MTLRLAAGDVSVEVDADAGARLASLVVGGRERLRREPDPAAVLPAITWGSFPMVPWVGRMAEGRLSWAGTETRLPATFGPHAIHGTGFDRAWEVEAVGSSRLVTGLDLAADGRWPFTGRVRQTIALEPGALELRLEVTAADAMPVALGWHPWFDRRPGEPMTVVVPASTVLETTDDTIPTGRIAPVDARTDLRRPADVGDRLLDHAYLGVAGPCRVAWSDLEIVIDAAPLVSVLAHTTPTAVCVEPQSAWPDAIRLAAAGHDTGLVRLAAGGRFEMSSRWTWRVPGS